MKFKPGVKVFGLKPEIMAAMITANQAYHEQGSTLTITSVTDGKHGRGSRHYSGMAFDCRTRDIDNPGEMADRIRSYLTDEYDVILEKTHIHVEYDPK